MPQGPLTAATSRNPSNQAVLEAVDAGGRPYSAPATVVNLTTANTTLIKSGSGVLRSITVGTAGTTSTITVYDSLSATGTVLGVFSTVAQANLALNFAFTIGLTVLTSGTAFNVTVGYN